MKKYPEYKGLNLRQVNEEMKYKKPENVKSPKSSIKQVKVLCDKGAESYSIAELNWDGKKRYGMRWNVSQNEWKDKNKLQGKVECKGMPTSRGYSIWFILPTEFDYKLKELI